MNIARFSFVIGMFCLPLSAHAKQSTSWDLTQNITSQYWMTNAKVEMTTVEEGIRFTTGAEEAAIRKTIALDHAVDVMYVTYKSPNTFEMKAAWMLSEEAEGDTYMSPVLFTKSDIPIKIGIDFTIFNGWNHQPKSIGFVLLPNTDVTIQSIELVGYNPFEKFIELVKGFWHFDIFRPSSINFVWGPRLTFNPVSRVTMYASPPPVAHSANTVFYVVAIGGVLFFLRRKNGHLAIGILLCSMWILYDLRMGSEFIQYLHNDYQSYYNKEVGIRTFRERLFFNDFAEAIVPVVADRSEYIFAAEYQWPYIGLMRYATYPSVPTHFFDGNANRLDTWIVYRRPDITIDDSGRLLSDGQHISPPGALLHEFDTGTFIFRTTQ